jgi:hypothetical protein
MDHWNKGSVWAVLLGVYATFALDVFSTLNSSPQTTELWASERKNSLLHWVYIGDAVAISGGAAASIISKKPAPIIGSFFVAIMMHIFYLHAVKRGLNHSG